VPIVASDGERIGTVPDGIWINRPPSPKMSLVQGRCPLHLMGGKDMEWVGAVLSVLGFLALMAAFLFAPIAMIIGLFWAARRRLQGRHSRFDGLFSGMARANQARNELAAGIPKSEGPDLVAPTPRRRLSPRRRGR
jgi:hypothetical protein